MYYERCTYYTLDEPVATMIIDLIKYIMCIIGKSTIYYISMCGYTGIYISTQLVGTPNLHNNKPKSRFATTEIYLSNK